MFKTYVSLTVITGLDYITEILNSYGLNYKIEGQTVTIDGCPDYWITDELDNCCAKFSWVF